MQLRCSTVRYFTISTHSQSEFDWATTHRVAAETREANYDLHGTAILWVLTDESYHRLSCTLMYFPTSSAFAIPAARKLHDHLGTIASPPRWKGRLRSWTPAVPGFLEGSRNLMGTVNRPRRRGDALLVHRPVAMHATNTTERLTPYLSRFHFSTKLTSNLQNCLPMIREIN